MKQPLQLPIHVNPPRHGRRAREGTPRKVLLHQPAKVKHGSQARQVSPSPTCPTKRPVMPWSAVREDLSQLLHRGIGSHARSIAIMPLSKELQNPAVISLVASKLWTLKQIYLHYCAVDHVASDYSGSAKSTPTRSHSRAPPMPSSESAPASASLSEEEHSGGPAAMGYRPMVGTRDLEKVKGGTLDMADTGLRLATWCVFLRNFDLLAMGGGPGRSLEARARQRNRRVENEFKAFARKRTPTGPGSTRGGGSPIIKRGTEEQQSHESDGRSGGASGSAEEASSLKKVLEAEMRKRREKVPRDQLTLHQACRVFYTANFGLAGDDDVTVLNFEEFVDALCHLALVLFPLETITHKVQQAKDDFNTTTFTGCTKGQQRVGRRFQMRAPWSRLIPSPYTKMKPNGNNGTATSNNNGDACDDAGSSSNTMKQSNNNEQSHSSSEPAHSSSEAEAPATAAAAPGIGVPVVKRVNQRAQGTQKKTRLLIKAGTGFRYCPSERRSHYPYLRGRGGESSIISEPPWGSVSLSLQIDSHSSDTHGWVTGPSPPNHQSSDGAAPCSRGEPTARVASPRSPPPDSISPSLLLTPPTPANTLPSKTHSRTCANTNATSSPTSDPKVESKGLLASPISVKTHEETLKCRSLDHSPRMANAEVARANVQQQRHSPECRSVQWTAASSSSDDDDEDEEDNIMRTPASPRPRALKQDEQREPTTPPLAKTEPRTPHGRTNATAAIPTWNALQKSLEHEKWRANAQRVAVAHALAIPRLCFPPGNRLVREYRQEKIMSRVGHILGDGGAHQPTPPSRQHSIARRKGAGKIQSGLMVGGVSSAGEKAKEKGLLHQKSFGAGGFSSADVSGRRVEHGDVVGGDDVDASSSDEDGANDQCEDTENEAGGGLDLLSLWTPDTTAQGEPDVTGDQVVARRSVHWPEQSTVIESPLAHDVHSLGGGYQALPEVCRRSLGRMFCLDQVSSNRSHLLDHHYWWIESQACTAALVHQIACSN